MKPLSHKIRARRRGYTLAELLVASVSASLLLVGMSSSLYIASISLDPGANSPRQKTKAAEVLTDIMIDLKLALSFRERTATAVTFTVPDRDGDRLPETIRYAWSGTAGDPLTYQYNGSSAVNVAENVQQLQFTALTRFMAAPVPPPTEGGANLLFVSGGSARYNFFTGSFTVAPTTSESARIRLFESWGYQTTIISAQESQDNITAQLNDHEVVYVSSDVPSTDLGTKLVEATIGVVNENPNYVDEFGFASDSSISFASALVLNASNHYIASGFADPAIVTFSASQSVISLSGTPASDLNGIGTWLTTFEAAPDDPIVSLDPNLKPISNFQSISIDELEEEPRLSSASLVTLNTGANTYTGATVAGRRVQLPWATGLDINRLSLDGRTLLQRSIAWAAGAGEQTTITKLLFVVTDREALTDQETQREELLKSWGYDLVLINDEDTPDNFAAAAASCDAAYVSTEVDSIDLAQQLASATLGIVSEHQEGIAVFGFGSGLLKTSDSETDITNASHYITQPFGDSRIQLFEFEQTLVHTAGSPSTGTTVLSQSPGNAYEQLAAIDVGGTLYSGRSSPGRRVKMPWGDSDFNFALLTDNGQTLLKRAITWAAGKENEAGSIETFRDDFESSTYSGNTGTRQWSTDWLEINESDGPGSGDEQIISDLGSTRLRVRDNDGGGEGVEREANLSEFTKATLTFDYRRVNLSKVDDYATIEVSADGGKSWTELGRLQGAANDLDYFSASYDISPYIATNTRIRFVTSRSMGSRESVNFDHVQITAE